MFKTLKDQVQAKFDKLAKQKLFYISIDREEIWNRYLDGFAPEVRQEYNCNACKSFLRQFGGIVTIDKNLEIVSIFDLADIHPEYRKAIDNVCSYIHSLPITDIFVNSYAKCGTDKNFDLKTGTTWQHFFVELPRQFVVSNPDAVRGAAREAKTMLQRALAELTVDATETVLELIAQNSLYRGKEFEQMLRGFLKIQQEYIYTEAKDNFCWVKSAETSSAITRIRNTAIGTLLIDLSEGMDVDTALIKYERVVAPSNYKRPTAAVTPKMIAAAKEKLADLGLLDALERRHATPTDLSVDDMLYTATNAKNMDVFDDIAAETLVNPKTLTKVEEIGIDDFIAKVLPTAKKISALVENKHLGNLFTLLTAQHDNVPSLFKWNNQFSWSYVGGVADSMKERVKKAGGKVDGVLRFSIQWNEDGKDNIDLDAHAIEPSRLEIAFNSYRKPNITNSTGQLDVDIINPNGKVAVENITWARKDKMPFGKYKFFVHNFCSRVCTKGFRAEIEFEGQLYEFNCAKSIRGRERIYVAEVNYSKTGFEIKPLLESKNSVSSTEKWGIKTQTYVPVNAIMLSPNHWEDNKIGNKHYMFVLDGCEADEARAFFNEYLKDELAEYRKVLEIVGNKVAVKPAKTQVSGLGFSETQRASLIVKVEGRFQRLLKINF